MGWGNVGYEGTNLDSDHDAGHGVCGTYSWVLAVEGGVAEELVLEEEVEEADYDHEGAAVETVVVSIRSWGVWGTRHTSE